MFFFSLLKKKKMCQTIYTTCPTGVNERLGGQKPQENTDEMPVSEKNASSFFVKVTVVWSLRQNDATTRDRQHSGKKNG